MATVEIRSEKREWRVAIDGHVYRVLYRDGKGSYPPSWDLYTANNDRWIDPEKPTYKRVLKAFQAHLNGGAS